MSKNEAKKQDSKQEAPGHAQLRITCSDSRKGKDNAFRFACFDDPFSATATMAAYERDDWEPIAIIPGRWSGEGRSFGPIGCTVFFRKPLRIAPDQTAAAP